MKPLARSDGLVVRDLADETLVYDRERHQAHCLDRVAGIVFQHCDGTRSPEEIAALLDEGEIPAAREATVRLALEQLSAAWLLVEVEAARDAFPQGREDGVASRRELLRLAALAVPMIASIVAPTPAQAASGCVPQGGCNSFNDCQPCADYGNDCSFYPGYYCDWPVSGTCATPKRVTCP